MVAQEAKLEIVSKTERRLTVVYLDRISLYIFVICFLKKIFDINIAANIIIIIICLNFIIFYILCTG